MNICLYMNILIIYSQYDISKYLLTQIVAVIYLTMMHHPEYFCAKDCLASREITSLKFHADRCNISIIANWKVTRL